MKFHGGLTTKAAEDKIINISDSCVKRLKEITGDNEGDILRVFVEGGGCSGFQCKFELIKETSKEDRLFEKEGVKIAIDEISLDYLKGATIDYEEKLIRSAFRITNIPSAEQSCSCGSSFALKTE